MSTRMYTLPVEQTQWHVPGAGSTTIFNWEYDEGRDKLLGLYEKGKTNQWNSNERLAISDSELTPASSSFEFLRSCSSTQRCCSRESYLRSRTSGSGAHAYKTLSSRWA